MKFLRIIPLLFIGVATLGQEVGMNYQAVIRDAADNLIAEEGILMRVTLEQNASIVYQEEHVLTSDAYGQIAFVIGTGTVLQGDYATIPWGDRGVEIAFSMFYGGGWTDLPQHDFRNVPYAYASDHSRHADTSAYALTTENALNSESSEYADSAAVAGVAHEALGFGGVSFEIGDADRINSSTFLTVTGNNIGGYNGMYVNTPDENGDPFYGYAVNGSAVAWHYYNPDTDQIEFYNSGNRVSIGNSGLVLTNIAEGLLTVDANGLVGGSDIYRTAGGAAVINGTTSINVNTELTVHSDNAGYGGMYINSTTGTGTPFYGYALDGTPEAWTYFDDQKWSLYNGGDRITATDDKQVGINNKSPEASLHIIQENPSSLNPPSGESAGKYLGLKLETHDGHYMSMASMFGAQLLFYSSEADMFVAGISGDDGNYIQISDSTLKKNIQSIDEALPQVMELHPVSYEFKSNDAHQYGFLAQEVQHVYPSMVKNMDGRLSLSYSEFSAIAIKAIQEQQALIEQLQENQEALTQEIDALKNAK